MSARHRLPLPRPLRSALTVAVAAVAVAGCGSSSHADSSSRSATTQQNATTTSSGVSTSTADLGAQELVEQAVNVFGEAQSKAGKGPVTVAMLHQDSSKALPDPTGLTLSQLVPSQAKPTQIYMVEQDLNYIICAPGADAVFCAINNQNVVQEPTSWSYGLFTTSKAVHAAAAATSGPKYTGDVLISGWPLTLRDFGTKTNVTLGSAGGGAGNAPREYSSTIDSSHLWTYSGA